MRVVPFALWRELRIGLPSAYEIGRVPTGKALTAIEATKPVAGVLPKLGITSQRLEWLEELCDFLRGIFLLARLLQFLDQIPEANRVLLILRMMPWVG